MLSSMRGMNQRLGIGAMVLVFFLAAIGFGRDAFTVNIGYVGAALSILFLIGVAWFEMLATRPDKRD